MFVAQLDDECWNLIKGAFKEKKFKSSSLASLRTIKDPEKRYKLLQNFEKSGWKTSSIVRDAESEKKKNKVSNNMLLESGDR